jgi:hypothetical protein
VVIGSDLQRLARSRSVLRLIWKCAGFIFCEFFSNVGGTGCRRGRTPERPLRQPSRVWLIARPFCLWPGLRGPLASALEGSQTSEGHKLVTQRVALYGHCPYGGVRLVSVSL